MSICHQSQECQNIVCVEKSIDDVYIVLYCILHAPIVRLAAFRWPKVFPSYPILYDFKSLVDVNVRDIAKK